MAARTLANGERLQLNMSNRLKYNYTWLEHFYNKKLEREGWAPEAKRGYRLFDLLTSGASDDDKISGIMTRLVKLAEEDKRANFTNEQWLQNKTCFWKSFRSSFEDTWIEDRNAYRILKSIFNRSAMFDFIDDKLIDIIKLIFKRVNAINGVSANRQFSEIISKINTEMQFLPPLIKVMKPDAEGVWKNVPEDEQWLHYGRHDNKYFNVDKSCMKENEINFGFEVEGVFPSAKHFQDCLTKLSKTPFEGGFLYDKRFWIIPTSDTTIRNGYGVEWIFAPFNKELGKKYFNQIMPILKEFGWSGEYSKHGSGIHCHIDAKLFNDKTLKKLIDCVYDTTQTEKRELYEQGSTYNSWNKGDCYTTTRKIIELDQYNEDGEQMAVIRKCIISNDRSTLLNLQNFRRNDNGTFKGTFELRGWNGKCDPSKLIDKIDAICKKARS